MQPEHRDVDHAANDDGDDTTLATGDAVKLFGPEQLRLTATATSELILIEVPETAAPVGVWRRS